MGLAGPDRWRTASLRRPGAFGPMGWPTRHGTVVTRRDHGDLPDSPSESSSCCRPARRCPVTTRETTGRCQSGGFCAGCASLLRWGLCTALQPAPPPSSSDQRPHALHHPKRPRSRKPAVYRRGEASDAEAQAEPGRSRFEPIEEQHASDCGGTIPRQIHLAPAPGKPDVTKPAVQGGGAGCPDHGYNRTKTRTPTTSSTSADTTCPLFSSQGHSTW